MDNLLKVMNNCFLLMKTNYIVTVFLWIVYKVLWITYNNVIYIKKYYWKWDIKKPPENTGGKSSTFEEKWKINNELKHSTLDVCLSSDNYTLFLIKLLSFCKIFIKN